MFFFYFQHPGGIYVMEEHLGFDATVAFRSAGHSTDAFTMLNEYLIGILPKNERIYENRIRWWKRKKLFFMNCQPKIIVRMIYLNKAIKKN